MPHSNDATTTTGNTTGNTTGAFTRVFLNHPASVDETYFQHMRFALGFAGQLGLAAGAALIHAVIPAACETTASRIVKTLYPRVANRGADTALRTPPETRS